LGKADDVLVAGQKALDIVEYLANLAKMLPLMAEETKDGVLGRMVELQGMLVDLHTVIKSYGQPGFFHRLWKMRKTGKTLAKTIRDIQRLFETLKDMYNLAKDRQMIQLLEATRFPLEAEVERRMAEREKAGESEESAAKALQSDPVVVQEMALAGGLSEKVFCAELHGFQEVMGERFDEAQTLVASYGERLLEGVTAVRGEVAELRREMRWLISLLLRDFVPPDKIGFPDEGPRLGQGSSPQGK